MCTYTFVGKKKHFYKKYIKIINIKFNYMCNIINIISTRITNSIR